MKTRKTLRITGWTQFACCLIMLLDFGIEVYYARTQTPICRGSLWFKTLDLLGGLSVLVWIAPTALGCLAFNLLAVLEERRDPEQRKLIGLRWLWIPVSFVGVLAVKWLYFWLIVVEILSPDRFPLW